MLQKFITQVLAQVNFLLNLKRDFRLCVAANFWESTVLRDQLSYLGPTL